jgi:thioredoxin reductase (NADPH)
VVRLTDGSDLTARAVIIATGVTWRHLGVQALEALVGAGAEARATTGQHVFVVGGGNSASQTALHLAKHAKSVTMLVRGPGLHPSMSEYLITEISERRSAAGSPKTPSAGVPNVRHT